MFDQLRQRRAATQLQRAFDQADSQRLQKALAAGASPNQLITRAKQAQPALEVALETGLLDHARLLVQAGAEIDNGAKLLSLTLALESQSLPILTLLLQAGVDPNSGQGEALFTALSNSDESRAQLLLSRLLEYGGNIDSRDANGCSLLELALQKEFRQLSSTLINAGAPLPEQLEQLACSEEIKALAKRCADDLAIRRMLQGN